MMAYCRLLNIGARLHSRTLWCIRPVESSLHLLILNSSSLPRPVLLASTSLFSVSEDEAFVFVTLLALLVSVCLFRTV